jgi:hypothetical protein
MTDLHLADRMFRTDTVLHRQTRASHEDRDQIKIMVSRLLYGRNIYFSYLIYLSI